MQPFVDDLDPCQLFAVSDLEGAPGTCSKYAEPAHLCSVLFGLQCGRVSRTKCCAIVGNISLKPQGSQVKLKFLSICSLGNFYVLKHTSFHSLTYFPRYLVFYFKPVLLYNLFLQQGECKWRCSVGISAIVSQQDLCVS